MLRILIFLIALMVSTQARSDIIEVSPGQSISTAAANSLPGDTILLTQGEYYENVQVRNHGVTICSNYLFSGDTTEISGTVIYADTSEHDSASCVFINLPNDVDSTTIVGLTMQDGRGTSWQIDGSTYRAGGGVFAFQSRLRMEHCNVTACRANTGGGVAVIQQAPTHGGTFGTLEDCVVSNCVASMGMGGGGMHAIQVPVILERTVFSACTSEFSGAYLALSARTTMHACTLRMCGSTIGAASVGSELESIISECVFESNGNPWNASYMGDCHLRTGGRVRVLRNIFLNNTTNDRVLVMFDFDRFGVPMLEGNVIESHIAGHISGIFYFWNCEGEISHNIIRNCYADYGPSLVPGGAGIMRIHHNVFTGNSQEHNVHGTVIDYTNAGSIPASCDSNIFEGNTGPVVSFDSTYPGPQYIIAHNNWWGDATGPYHPTLNPGGQGDTLTTDRIRFIPWLTEPPDTSQHSDSDHRPRPAQVSTWELLPVYPNPFNSTFTVEVAGFTRSDFELSLYDLLGRRVTVLHEGPIAQHTLRFSAKEELASGVYFLVAGDHTRTNSQKVLFLK